MYDQGNQSRNSIKFASTFKSHIYSNRNHSIDIETKMLNVPSSSGPRPDLSSSSQQTPMCSLSRCPEAEFDGSATIYRKQFSISSNPKRNLASLRSDRSFLWLWQLYFRLNLVHFLTTVACLRRFCLALGLQTGGPEVDMVLDGSGSGLAHAPTS